MNNRPDSGFTRRQFLARGTLAAEPEPAKDELDWDLWLGACPWRPYNAAYVNGGGWYHLYDFATDVAMWGAHTVAQALAGLDMTNESFIEFTRAALSIGGREKTKFLSIQHRRTAISHPRSD
jgi:hypothetical protein